MNAQQLKHWQVSVDDEGIVSATLDQAGAGTNTLSREVMGELARIVEAAEAAPPRGLIFRSGKAAGFIA